MQNEKGRSERQKSAHEAELAAADARHQKALEVLRSELMGGAEVALKEANEKRAQLYEDTRMLRASLEAASTELDQAREQTELCALPALRALPAQHPLVRRPSRRRASRLPTRRRSSCASSARAAASRTRCAC